MKVIIEVGSIWRQFELDEDEITATDWNATVEDMIDSINKAKDL